MKKLTTILTISAMMLAASCNKATMEHEGSAVALDYTVSVTEAATKALLGDGSNVDKMAYAVYDGETCVKSELINEQEEGKFAFQPALYYGKTYTVAMFAYKDGAYNVSDLKAITKSANDETADAFAHTETVMIDHNGDLYINGIKSDDQTSNHAVTLTRPVAQLAVATEVFDEMAQAGAAKIQVELSAPSTYNAVLSAPTTPVTSNYTSTVANLGTIEVSGKTYAVVSCNYLLPTDTQIVTVKVLKADDTVIRTIALDNVPLVANKKTQIYGNLVKGELTFNVTVSAGFDAWDSSDKGKVDIE